MTDVLIPLTVAGNEEWLVLNKLGNKGLLRAVRIDKRKRQVLDWDGHHCDEASADGSIRYRPKVWRKG